MITNFFIPELNNHDVQELWFQQDGATCHTARATIDLLKDTFGDRIISRFGPVNWPPRSCDLTPLDYFLYNPLSDARGQILPTVLTMPPPFRLRRWSNKCVSPLLGSFCTPALSGVHSREFVASVVESRVLVQFPSKNRRVEQLMHVNPLLPTWYWDRTRDQASHDPIPIPLGYRGLCCLKTRTHDYRNNALSCVCNHDHSATGLFSVDESANSILVVKETDSWLTCHDFEPRTSEDPPYIGDRCTLSMSRFKRPPVGRLLTSLDYISKLRGQSQKALE
ncbi:uncharacterized protein TNCV_232921 [Trichonephila clavipes]|nr:uncharacterized protein TNCV_232921 [Trichonephila clavipes]